MGENSMSDKPLLLIVDDSIMDRMVLRNIIDKDYDVIEAQNGYGALEIIQNNRNVKGMLLDISMPVLDGFGVLNNMSKQALERVPTLLISSEARKETIMKAAKYSVAGFIKKPFNATMILAKLKTIFEQNGNFFQNQKEKTITENELKASWQYIEKLKKVYDTYLTDEGKDDTLYKHVSEIVRILVSEYYLSKNPKNLTPEGIEIISQAAYFYDIGRIVIRNEKKLKRFPLSSMEKTLPQTHTIAGADFISVNSSPNVAFFVKIASDMCMHHHERCDGQGFPHGLRDSINNIYTQFLSLAIEFCTNFFNHDKLDVNSFDFAASVVYNNKGAYRNECTEILELCQDEIINFYQRNPL